MSLRILTSISVLITMISSNNISCHTTLCNKQDITCNDNEDCFVECLGQEACAWSKIYCPNSSHSCTILCDRGFKVCYYTSIFGGGGALTATALDSPNPDDPDQLPFFNLGMANIQCPLNQPCNIFCIANSGMYGECRGVTIHAENASRLSIEIRGESAITNGYIYCPPNYKESIRCTIISDETASGKSLSSLHIYATHGVNDVEILCNEACLEGNGGNGPTVYCTAQYQHTCDLYWLANDTFNTWQCENTSAVCNDYVSPTLTPSVSPTLTPTYSTSAPTSAPTVSPLTTPYSSSTVLFV
eukprot:488737_1